MGGKGVEPLRTFVHTVLSRTRLPFRHSPMYVYYKIFSGNCKVSFILIYSIYLHYSQFYLGQALLP